MSRDTTFYYSFLVLPPRKRNAIIAVWDFCRAVDDAVDEGGHDASAAICFWRHELARCYEGAEPETLQGRRLQP
jgi:phytoene synthase